MDAALPLDRLTGSIADAGYLIAWRTVRRSGMRISLGQGPNSACRSCKTSSSRLADAAGVGTALTRKAERLWPPKGMINSP